MSRHVLSALLRITLPMGCSIVLSGCATTPPRVEGLEGITQTMANAVAPGDAAVWDRFTDAAFVYVTEDNEVKDKAAVLADLHPLPPGFSGRITIEEFRARQFDGFAVTTYTMAETETVEGQVLHARYRETDTWSSRDGQWRLVAAQVMAVNKDPPAVPPSSLTQYAGTYFRSLATSIVLRPDGEHLIVERRGRPPYVLLAEAPDVFFQPGKPRTRQVFFRAADGTIAGFAERREGEDLLWRRR
jgi:hypothetical protein